MPKSGNWNKTQDAKLSALLKQGKKRGINPTNLKKDYIQIVVIGKHFPDQKFVGYDSFARLYCRKVRVFNLNKALQGGQANQG